MIVRQGDQFRLTVNNILIKTHEFTNKGPWDPVCKFETTFAEIKQAADSIPV
jgi:hypothetical protein